MYYVLYFRNNSVSPINQLLICLRVYATGTHLLAVADLGGVHTSTVSRIVVRVTEAISNVRRRHLKMPANAEEINKNKNDFFRIASFPHVIGVIGTHIYMHVDLKINEFLLNIYLF